MKLFRFFLLLILFSPFLSCLANVEIFQVVSFVWNAETEKLEAVSHGSGTAIDKNLVLTNKHVVFGENGVADFVLLCQGESRTSRPVRCNIPAGVTVLHEKFDAALIRPLSKNVFLPFVKTSSVQRQRGDSVRIKGFPIPLGDSVSNFGSTKTFEKTKEWTENGGMLEIGGDKMTITRGQIQNIGIRRETGEKFLITDAKVNFGNSGGAAFDNGENFIGIPSLKDKDSNALILAFDQIESWVNVKKEIVPKVSEKILNFYKKATGESITSLNKTNKSLKSRTKYQRQKSSIQKETRTSTKNNSFRKKWYKEYRYRGSRTRRY